MGSVIGFPAALLSAIAEKGITHFFVQCVIYLYFRISRFIRGKRFNDYDLTADGQPQKNGFLARDIEWEVDPPQLGTPLNQVADDAFCFGTNSSSEFLLVHISRKPNNKVQCSLILKLPGGREFSLPEEHSVQQESEEPYTFGHSRLKLQCLQPMRKWRVFFNGLLKEESSSAEPVYKHVKFTFIWTASSEVFDFSKDLPENVLAKSMADENTLSSFTHLEKIKDILNHYEQPGMFLGTYVIKGEPEKELYLWGIRGRFLGRIRELKKADFVQIYGQFQSGAALHLEILNIPGIISKLLKGYVMHSSGFINAITELEEEQSENEKERVFRLHCGKRKQHLIVKCMKSENVVFYKEYEGSTDLKRADMLLDQIEGRGFIFKGHVQESLSALSHEVKETQNIQNEPTTQLNPLVIHFENPECQNHNLTGGKGSSLSKLSALSKEIEMNKKVAGDSFHVPKGIVVTTEAYKLFIEGKLEADIEDFQKSVWNNPKSERNQLCERIMKEIIKSVLPKKLAFTIGSNLEQLFGDAVNEMKFAVRSSATGEDTEQMSAAGQMETFLGLKSLNQILDAVKKCWASQFSFEAIEYKRRYGQLLNSSMAVVIQQLVPCEAAGVLFTCDPVTGDPSFITITGNWGLGETVVSASADPDTIILERDIKNKMKFQSYQIGHKEKKIIIDSESGTKEVDVGIQSKELCLDEKKAFRLGQIALNIEAYYGSPRDIEWGILDEEFYIFQARPVTSIDIDTDFENKHMFDNFVRMEKEYNTTANIGEVMPGAASPLGVDVISKAVNTMHPRQGKFRLDGHANPDAPYFQKVCIYACNHGFLSLIDGMARFSSDDTFHSKSMMVSLLGRVIDDTEMKQIAIERYSHHNLGIIYRVGIMIKLFQIMFLVGPLKKKIKKLGKIEFPSMKGLSAAEILHQIGLNFHYLMQAGNVHLDTSMSSSNWNMILLKLLAKASDDIDTDVYNDFAYILSACNDVESADVPTSIENLGKIIRKHVDIEKFKSMDPEDALKYLKSSGVAGDHFQQFIEKHGHRCLREFDIQSHTWESELGMLNLIEMLQGYASMEIKEITKKNASTFSAIFSNMHVHLDFFSKLKLRLLIPKCRQAVALRESSKSSYIKNFNKVRKSIQKLAIQMVKEGYLPDEDLIYYLCFEEINQLIKTRSPRLLTRAIRRQRVRPELEKIVFPEICIGVQKPINADDEDIAVGDNSVMQGIPVSQGVVRGKARVITDINKVSSIKKDEILITRSTDIGWTPYFPLLSGVVTELGGLISHGAVVAREYGLPCVVSLHGATKVFKSGDIVYLDGNKGILKKVEENKK